MSNQVLFEELFPLCARALARIHPLTSVPGPEGFPSSSLCILHPWLEDLAAIDLARHRIENISIPQTVKQLQVNPALEIVEVAWKGLNELIRTADAGKVSSGKEFILVCRPGSGERVQISRATGHQLLALKMILEGLDSHVVAAEAATSVGVIDEILDAAVAEGLLLSPGSQIRRSDDFAAVGWKENVLTAETFTLQWHLTQRCDLHCRHCYDRSDRNTMSLAQGLSVLEQLYRFCRSHHVTGQVSFSGGNPLLSPHFDHLYERAASLGLLTAILGNPTDRATLERIIAINPPAFFQVSLEGLQPHNDYIRGVGHFARTLDFLELLREYDIYSMVMLTLTRANQSQVLDLAELLRGRVDLFTFNRLAMVGEGAALASVQPESYEQFLHDYLQAARQSPHMGLKDNLFNHCLEATGCDLTGGCTGFGCGAAFNFLSLLPDGEVHVCRKLPSPLGNLLTTDLKDLYYSEQARQYRRGPEPCKDCSIRPVCGGCMAVAYGFGLDIFTDLDPCCMRRQAVTGVLSS